MARQSVDDLYGGRHFPHGRVRDGSHRRIESEPSLESGNTRGTAFNRNTNQDPESKYDAGYHNDVSAADWKRGGGAGGATGKPSFDRGNAWRAGRDGVDHGPGDPAIIRRPVGEK